MDLLYSSTRNSEKKITASQAILKGLADDGGLFVPESIPALDVSIEELSKMSYQQVAYEVMKPFSLRISQRKSLKKLYQQGIRQQV